MARIKEARGVEADLVKGDNGVFDVVVDGELIYSKQQTGRFPDPEEILAKLG